MDAFAGPAAVATNGRLDGILDDVTDVKRRNGHAVHV